MAEPVLKDATEERGRTADTLTVSRKAAQTYETYDIWAENRDGMFGDLGKFLVGEAGQALSQARIRGTEVKVRSSVENLRNMVPRVVEFYATTMLSGTLDEAMPLKVEAQDEDDQEPEDGDDQGGESGDRAETLKDAILLHWEWSQMGQQKQVAKRFLAKYGQVFDKIVKPEGKDHCYQQFVRPSHVTDFETDPRGNVVFIRLDTPKVRVGEDGRSRKVWVTEIWRKGGTAPPKPGEREGQKEAGYALFTETERNSADSVPSERAVREASGARRVKLGGAADGDFRFDFVPFVVVNAQDTGEKRPRPVYDHGLHLITWVCREATRLSDLMFRFNKAFKVVFGMGNDASGRPIPPPKPDHVRDLNAVHQEQQADARGEHTVPFAGHRATMLSREQEDISIEGIAVTGLPGTAQMADATPNINYEAARQWISDHLREVYEELPELLYYAVESRANQSGAALRTLIAGALSRAEEMQANLLTGIVKADKMALTIAQLEGFKGFSAEEIGTYEGGGFDHEIEPPEILPPTEEEKQKAEQGKLSNAQTLTALLTQLGVPEDKRREKVLTGLGYEDLIGEAGEATRATEGEPAPADLAASQQALAARLEGQQTQTGGDGAG